MLLTNLIENLFACADSAKYGNYHFSSLKDKKVTVGWHVRLSAFIHTMLNTILPPVLSTMMGITESTNLSIGIPTPPSFPILVTGLSSQSPLELVG
jgi:hypothetical protein